VTNPDRSAPGLPDPVFFGLLEGMSFLCLFCSPLFVGQKVWLAIALLRVVVFSVVLLPGRAAPSPAPDARSVARFLRQGILYQAPFWLSALLFPLQLGQAVHACQALLLSSFLLALLPWLVAWIRAVGAEAMVYLLTLGWVVTYRPPGVWLAFALVIFLATCRGPWGRPWGWEWTNGLALAVGLAWLVVFALPPLSVPMFQSSATVLFWILLLYLGAVMSLLQSASAKNDEAEEALPLRQAASVWMLGRRSASIGLGWAALPALLVQRPEEAVAFLIFLSSWGRGLRLASRRWFTAERVVWWAAAEMTLVWAAEQLGLALSMGILGISLLWLALEPMQRLARQPAATHGLASLEALLVSGLRQTAPPHFAASVLRDTGSVELDTDLLAAAPAGFRQRLLDRLKKASDELD
jgi:hypothetical protein